MGGDKHGSKSGRYVGGLLHLFDWNAKSKKKLFSSKSDSPEHSKQGKNSKGNLPMTRIRLVDEEEYGAGLSIKGGSDYSCASSVTDEDGYGTKAPGVVARLMGLDSLPTSIPLEPYSTPFFDTLSLRDAPYNRRNIEYYHDHQMVHSSLLLDKVESLRGQALDTRHHKTPSRAIDKFQTEILPPKSAKMIPITQNKLLSPIKSPIFVPSQDAAHIMEAAAKIIEPGPQATPRTRLSSSGSSSVPFKVRELKEKLEGAQKLAKAAEPSQKPVESNAAKYLKGQPLNKSWNGSLDTTSFKFSPSRDDGSAAGVKNKGKSISLAIQAKVNVQKREGLAQSSRSLGGADEQDNHKSIQSFRSQPNGPRITNRKSSAQSSSSVLRQNNQKQNSAIYGDKPASKTSVTMSAGKKVVSEDISQGRQKSSVRDAGPSRTSSRKSSLQAREGDKEAPHSGVKNAPRKKRSIDNMQASKHEKPSHSKMSDKQFSWIEESRRKGTDVVSFTFTAPITRTLSGSELSKHSTEKSSNLCGDDRNKRLLSADVSRLSSPGLNGIRGGDALSILLEQKLKELTSNFETSSDYSFIKNCTDTESSQQTVTPCSSERGSLEEKAQQVYSSLSSTKLEEHRKYDFQGVGTMGKFGSSKDKRKQWNDCHLPSPVSILEPSILTESCYSESIASSSTEESKQCSSSVQAQEVFGLKNQTTQTEPDTLDSVSSTPSQTGIAKDSLKSSAWELGYVKDILSNVELMFKDYATGRTREIVNPHLFDQMERRREGLGARKNEFRLERKMLFDCVSECLDLRCQRFVVGGFETWAKGTATVKRKDRLAEEVYKEIQGWRSLGNNMVDELVDKDMSSKYGRWLDFEVDEFMLGVEVEGQILDSLVMEIVADILP
ncbi:hypothetical protein Cgig2_029194 [Carnegiea gigantea]|uniref:DUF4378 domain-containing protein n=1 Tax=Carnegiea gigantea TaxID=171969 RepID=A0A9Q1KL91_9CARY|nr:hypothetical protein Cgig2_029194 [Carnegiea gigantea]